MLKILTRRTGLIFAGLGSGVILLILIIFILVNSGQANNSQVNPGGFQIGISPPNSGELAVSSPAGNEYLALGDSIAFGVGASSPQESGYPAVFYRQYLTKALPGVTSYKNLALPGETTTSFISRPKAKSQLEMALNELDTGLKTGPRISLITLTIGGNDVLPARTKSQAEKETILKEFDTNFQKILGELGPYTLDGKTRLIVTTYYNPFGTNGIGGAEDAAWLERFNNVIKQRAEEHKVKVADFFTPILAHEKSLTWIEGGDIHPNTAGHAALADALWQAAGYTLTPSTTP